MKKSTIALPFLLAVAIVVSFSSNSSDSSTKQLLGKPQKEYKQMSGVLSFIDPPGRSIIVSNATMNRKFDVAAEAEILRNGKTCALADLRKGNSASIYYSVEQGTRLAHRVAAYEGAPPPTGHGKQETRPLTETSAR